jgi:hypothetical protein
MIDKLEKWQKTIEETDMQIDRLRDFFGCVDCEFLDAMEKLQCDYTKAVAEIVGDDSGWLIWYWLDNSMGEYGREAGYDGNLSCIYSLQDLCALIATGIDKQAGVVSDD